jgi:hypothetical protein
MWHLFTHSESHQKDLEMGFVFGFKNRAVLHITEYPISGKKCPMVKSAAFINNSAKDGELTV